MAKPKRRKRFEIGLNGRIDTVFLSLVLILLTIGLVMLFSASYAFSYTHYNNSYRFILRQGGYALFGVFMMFVFSKIDYHIWRRFSWVIFGISTLFLIVLLILPPMVQNMGVKRWFVIGPVNFQPSETAKFALIVLFSTLISANYKQMRRPAFVFTLLGILAVTCVLIVAEPHLSATILIFLIGVVLMVVGGLQMRYIIGGGLLAGGGVAALLLGGVIGYGSDRFKYWINPWLDPANKGFQTIQSLLAIGSGGIMGRGIGQSRQKYLWVPEPHNDFIFSIVCEELGLIGAMVIIILFALLVWRGFTIAMRSPDKFGSLLAIGLTFQVGLQAMLNIFVVTNTMPNTGISLPFFSYGGTSLVLLLAEMGIVLSVSRSANLEKT